MTKSFLTRPIFGDDDMAQHFDDAALARAMLDVEAALARVEGALGVIPDGSAKAIAASAARLDIDIGRLDQGVAGAGVPVPALVAALREAVGTPHDDWVHWGATSQDIVDTAMSIVHARALDLLEARLTALIDGLHEESRNHNTTLMVARTRGQLATPISFGLRVAQWAQPLLELEAELPEVRRRALKVQFGGASGSCNVLAPHGAAVAEGMADTLGLRPAVPWHTDRSGQARMTSWLSGIATAVAKMSGDLILSGRVEIGEVQAGVGGGSSTMPQKANPVTAEAILSLSRVALACETGLSASRAHAEERDGGMWAVEWLLLPQLFEATAAALRHALTLADDLRPDAEAMCARLDATPEVFAEAAVFALAGKVGRQEASRLVKEALSSPEPFSDALRRAAPEGIDLDAALSPDHFTGPAAEVSRAIFALRGKVHGNG